MARKFNAELRCQQEWGWLLAIWLFLGSSGSALFLFFAVAGLPTDLALVSLGLLGVGGLVLLYELGSPLRAWRGIFRASTSWLSRGVVSVVLFVVSATLFIAPRFASFAWLPWDENSVGGKILGGIAGLSALMIVLYPGFFLSKNRSIPFWNTPLLPVVLIVYAASGACGVVLLAAPFLTADVSWVTVPAGVLVAVTVLAVALYVVAGVLAGGPAAESVRRLNRGNIGWLAWLGIVVVGMVFPLAAILWDGSMAAPAGGAILIGGFLFRYCVLKVGVYVPPAAVVATGIDFKMLNRTSANLEREYASMTARGGK